MRIRNLTLTQNRSLQEIRYIPYISSSEWEVFQITSSSEKRSLVSLDRNITVIHNIAEQIEKSYKGFLNWLLEDSLLSSFIILFKAPVI